MAGAASQAGDADSSRATGLTSGLQGYVNVHRGALYLVPQWQCISSYVFYISSYTDVLWIDPSIFVFGPSFCLSHFTQQIKEGNIYLIKTLIRQWDN